jgi:2-polyprenyl-6-methoxyphenol hydroxylase-like FAD-dependent oxidoreductase
MMTDVVIVGGGPNGLMLAAELRLAGISPIVLERLTEPSQVPKANGLLGQVVRLIERRGLYQRLSGNAGPPVPNRYFLFAGLGLDLSAVRDNPVCALPIPQHRLEQVLEDHARALDADIRRGHEVTGFAQDDDGIDVDVTGPDGTYRLRTRYLVGADGAHSQTRKRCGIDFPGITYDRRTLRMAHVRVPGDWVDATTGGLNVPGHGTVFPFVGVRTETGGFNYAPMPGLPPTIATTEWDQPEHGGPLTFDELRASIRRVLGADVPIEPPAGAGPHLCDRLVHGNTRLAGRFRDGRVFLVGDAAHIYAQGGSGLNLGMQDAVNLAWKLAAVLRGDAPDGLLDSYDTERRAAALRIVTYAGAVSALLAPGRDVTALRALFGELMSDTATAQRLADLTAGTDVRYDMGGDGPVTGRFAPDLLLHNESGPIRLADLTTTARPLLLDLTVDGSAAAALSDEDGRVDVITGRAGDSAVTALLLRPDCYVAWSSASPSPDDEELAALRGAARRWFGVPSHGLVGTGAAAVGD